MVGGTGLYFRALTQGLARHPAIAARGAPSGRSPMEAGRGGRRANAVALWRSRGRERASRRATASGLLRALEVPQATGRSSAAWQADTAPLWPSSAWRGVVLEPPREALYARCDARLAACSRPARSRRWRALMARELDPALPAMKAVGVRELARHPAGALTRAERPRRRPAGDPPLRQAPAHLVPQPDPYMGARDSFRTGRRLGAVYAGP